MRLQPPHDELSHIQLNFTAKWEEKIRQTVMFKGIDFFKSRSTQKQFFLGEQAVDPIQPYTQHRQHIKTVPLYSALH